MFERGKKEGSTGQIASVREYEAGAAPAGSMDSGESRAGSPKSSGKGAIIGSSIQINGDVKGDEDLLIEGDVTGTVELKNHVLTIGKDGTVKANIQARAIMVDGTTDGDLTASESISIRATADVRGNLLAPRVALEDGARLKGSIEMDQQSVDKALGGSNVRSAGPEPFSSKSVSDDSSDEPKSAVGGNS
jgi:cytoskeletal protein CcmA (bactofilin family)